MTEKQISVLTAFVAAKADFAVVGGQAVIMHGYVRTTHDLDVFIRPTLENAETVFDALRKVGMPLNGLEAADLLSDEDNVRFGPADNHFDILSSIGEMSFDQVWRNRVTSEIEGLPIPFISVEDLIANKRQVGRLRDLADAEELEKIEKRRSSGPGRSCL